MEQITKSVAREPGRDPNTYVWAYAVKFQNREECKRFFRLPEEELSSAKVGHQHDLQP